MFGIDPNSISDSIRASLASMADTLGTLPGGLGQQPSKTSAKQTSPDWFSQLASPGRLGFTPVSWPSRPSGPTPSSSGFAGPQASWPTVGPKSGVVTQPFAKNSLPLSSANPANSGNIDQQRQETLDIAKSMFGEEGSRVLNATFSAENGWGGMVGDTNLNAAGSHGPLQFYGGGGQLNNFANQMGMTVEKAGEYVRANPVEAVKWALNGYYGQALQAGMNMGLKGADLAEYVQMNGQRSDPRSTGGRATAAYHSLYG